ncbi:MAG: DUF2577 family protein [Candidatus Fimivivens sp.]|nr:DUF2577 family protein [Candidatus Fimivivens sp.]
MTAIKMVVRDYLHNEDLSDVLHATYTGAGIRIDGRPNVIPAAFVDVPLSLQTVEAKLSGTLKGEVLSVEGAPVTKITLTDAPVTITRGLVAGDRVTVVKQRGGQRYSIIDRTGG